MPNIENRVELASDKDEFGMPLGRLTHSFDEDAVALWNANLEEGMKSPRPPAPRRSGSGRAGHTDDPSARRHHHGHGRGQLGGQQLRPDATKLPNLYDRRAGIFPTEGASNPTYTIFAVSLRGAEQLAANWATVAG